MEGPLLLILVLVTSSLAVFSAKGEGLRTCQPYGNEKGNAVMVVTYVTDDRWNHTGFSNFARSLHRFGYKYANAASGQSTTSDLWRSRTESYAKFAARQPKEMVLVFTDAFDVLFQHDPGELAKKYWATGYDVVFAAERLCDTMGCITGVEARAKMDRLAGNGTSHKYLNMGTMVATAQNAAIFLQAVAALQSSEGIDDQTAAVRLMTGDTNEYNVGLDYMSHLFGVVSPASQHLYEDWEATGKGELVRRGGGRPTALHFAGMKYQGKDDEKFTPCQRFQMETYNALVMGMEGRIRLQTQLRTRRRVVVSLVTTPARIGQLQDTLDSLLAQTHAVDHIYVNLPQVENVVIPENLLWYSRVTVLECEDYGPATKLIPVLGVETNPETMIVTVYDTLRYPKQMVHELVTQMDGAPYAAYGFAGYMLEDDLVGDSRVAVFPVGAAEHGAPQGVDVLEGSLGVGYLRKFFAEGFSRVDLLCWKTDDFWVAQHLMQQSIPRVKVPMPFPRPTETANALLVQRETTQDFYNEICALTMKSLLSSWRLLRPQPCAVRFQALEGWDDDGRVVGGIAPWWSPESAESPCNFWRAASENHKDRVRVLGKRAWPLLAVPLPLCFDGVQNGNETGVDCGGNCTPCSNTSTLLPPHPTGTLTLPPPPTVTPT
eukprot:Sspe_Gene.114667::Locus_100844_Transcript_1_1_Confidence_1.000_Length_2013::g.114667::m.114667